MRAHAGAGACLVVAVVGTPVPAQRWDHRVDIGAAIGAGAAGSLAPLVLDGSLGWYHDRWSIAAGAGTSAWLADAALGKGHVNGTVRLGRSPLAPWLEATADVLRRSDDPRRANRFMLSWGPSIRMGASSVSARLTVAQASWVGPLMRAQAVELALDRQLASLAVRLAATWTGFQDSLLVVRDTIYTVAGFNYVGSAETQLPHRFRHATLDGAATGSLGAMRWRLRVGMREAERPADEELWAQGGVEFPVGTRLSLALDAGRRPPVPEQHLRASPYAAVSLRWRIGSANRALFRVSRSEQVRVTVGTALTGDTLRITGVRAHAVQVMGDFTDWLPAALRPERGAWVLVRHLGRGPRRILMRVDGGPWRAPPGLPAVPDEFHDAVGLLLVP
jgi:hypothetical protein